MSKTTKPYGLWDSPLTPATMALGLRLGDAQWDTDGQTLVWLEGRSDRGVLVAQGPGDDSPRDLTETQNVRAFVGYGGGDFTVAHGTAYYVEKTSSRLYRLPLAHGQPQPITPPFGAAASPAVSPDGRWLVYVHSDEHTDLLGLVDTAGAHWPGKLATGADFYMQPAWHPDSRRLAWIEWDHPNMPWDGTRLMLGALAEGGDGLPGLASKEALIAEADVSVAQPQFTPDGRYLIYLCDRSGWTNLYRYDLATGEHRQLTTDAADIARAAWSQGLRDYAIGVDGRIYYARSQNAFGQLWSVSINGGDAAPLGGALDRYTNFSQPAVSSQDRLAVTASASRLPTRLVSVALDAPDKERIHARGTAERIPPELYSPPEAISWPTQGGDTVHGLYYPPHNPGYESTGKPPLIVMVHGGPTGQSPASFSAQTQFFTTRGYAVLSVNYRGSTGYGKAYMAKLRGQWGVVDVEDTASGAQFLAQRGLVDAERLIVMGGSAGGFTVLLSLIRHPGLFKAGLCMFGVSNLFTLAADTHKFEQHYTD